MQTVIFRFLVFTGATTTHVTIRRCGTFRA